MPPASCSIEYMTLPDHLPTEFLSSHPHPHSTKPHDADHALHVRSEGSLSGIHRLPCRYRPQKGALLHSDQARGYNPRTHGHGCAAGFTAQESNQAPRQRNPEGCVRPVYKLESNVRPRENLLKYRFWILLIDSLSEMTVPPETAECIIIATLR